MKVELQNENQNSASNFNRVSIGDLDLYFSYETIIAFRSNDDQAKIQNGWGPTTGKHLGWAPCGEHRLPADEFQERLNAQLAKINK